MSISISSRYTFQIVGNGNGDRSGYGQWRWCILVPNSLSELENILKCTSRYCQCACRNRAGIRYRLFAYGDGDDSENGHWRWLYGSSRWLRIAVPPISDSHRARLGPRPWPAEPPDPRVAQADHTWIQPFWNPKLRHFELENSL